jgi:hypothetical protein
MVNDQEAQESIDFIREKAQEYADAAATVVYIENALKRVKAKGMMDSDKKTLGDREADSYLTIEYEEMLQGLKAAVSNKEALRWMMDSHKMRFEKWKTEQFNSRVEARAL